MSPSLSLASHKLLSACLPGWAGLDYRPRRRAGASEEGRLLGVGVHVGVPDALLLGQRAGAGGHDPHEAPVRLRVPG